MLISSQAHGFFTLDLALLTAFNVYNCKLVYKMFTGNENGRPQTPSLDDFEDEENIEHETQNTVNSFFNPQKNDPTSYQFKKAKNKKYTFANIAGEIPEDVKELPDFIRNKQEYLRLGARIPKGVLLYGPPGTGKTSIARAIAGEADAAFVSASASEFVEVYVGVGPQRIRELFAQAEQERLKEKRKYAIIFIDEIDAIGGKRGAEQSSEYRNTLNELLNQMDGFEKNTHITVIAATNTPNSLDSALLRRFERKVEIPLPNETSRRAILQLYLKKTPFTGSQEMVNMIAKKSEKFSGADLELIINEAACTAVREKAQTLTDDHLVAGFKKIAAGKGIK